MHIIARLQCSVSGKRQCQDRGLSFLKVFVENHEDKHGPTEKPDFTLPLLQKLIPEWKQGLDGGSTITLKGLLAVHLLPQPFLGAHFVDTPELSVFIGGILSPSVQVFIFINVI